MQRRLAKQAVHIFLKGELHFFLIIFFGIALQAFLSIYFGDRTLDDFLSRPYVLGLIIAYPVASVFNRCYWKL